MSVSLRNMPFLVFNRDWKLQGGTQPQVGETTLPTISMNGYLWIPRVKSGTLDLTGVSGTFVGFLYADDGKRIKLVSAYRGASTGYTRLAIRQEKDLDVAHFSPSEATGNKAYPIDFEMDEMALGLLATANGADGSISISVIYYEMAT